MKDKMEKALFECKHHCKEESIGLKAKLASNMCIQATMCYLSLSLEGHHHIALGCFFPMINIAATVSSKDMCPK